MSADTEDAADGWVSIDDIAKSAGLNRTTVARRVAKFEGEGLVLVRHIDGRKMVDKGSYDRACEIALDISQSLNASGRKRANAGTSAGNSSALALAQARRTALAADILEMRVAEMRKTLLSADEVAGAVARAGASLARGLDALPTKAQDFATVVTHEGVQGLRAALKAYAREMRERLAADMSSLAAEGADREDAGGAAN